MADKREPTTTLPLPVSTLGTSSNPLYNKIPFGSLQTSPARPQFISTSNAGISTPQKHLGYKQSMSPRFEAPQLTGAAAIADNARHDKELGRRLSPGITPNPAKNMFIGMAGQSQPMSKATDGPMGPANPHSLKLPVIQADSPASETSRAHSTTVASPIEMTTPIDRSVNNVAPNPRKRPASPKADERPNKAMTYPPPKNTEEEAPRRDLTFPAQSSSQAPGRSPQSSKKHKCPHCATEFTRHHNLKSHLLTHSQEKPYGCQQCPSRFRRLHDLKRHIKLHTGEKSHTCGKCGRRFARGDALARHNKGPGGCAGRRGSTGEGDDYEEEGTSEVDQSMEGVKYHGGDSREPYEEDERYADDTRRRSEPDRAFSDTMNSAVSSGSGSFHQHSSTYPGLAPLSRGQYPPVDRSNQSTAPSPKEAPKHLSPVPPFSAVHYNHNTSPYPQGNITESPKPLSPGQPDSHRSGYSKSPMILQQRLPSRSHNGESTFGNLQPPSSQGTTLPSLSADPRFFQTSTGGQPPTIYTSQHNTTGSSSSHAAIGGSSSSQAHNNSANSMRDAITMMRAQPTQQQPQDALVAQVQNLERELTEVTERSRKQKQHYEAEISRLKEEVNMLRAQQVSSQSQVGSVAHNQR